MVITAKATIRDSVERLRGTTDLAVLAMQIDANILQHKVKFPLLEFAATELLKAVPEGDWLILSDKIFALNRMGSSVICGIILQQHSLKGHTREAFERAGRYMEQGNEWFVCDIIAERVMGHSLLLMPQKVLPLLHELSKAANVWHVRSVGVAAHYATKKGLTQVYAEKVFLLLLSMANTTELHAKTGTGWGAKTIAKFHPGIIENHHNDIYNNPAVRQWFITKVNIGLSRKEKYAKSLK